MATASFHSFSLLFSFLFFPFLLCSFPLHISSLFTFMQMYTVVQIIIVAITVCVFALRPCNRTPLSFLASEIFHLLVLLIFSCFALLVHQVGATEREELPEIFSIACGLHAKNELPSIEVSVELVKKSAQEVTDRIAAASRLLDQYIFNE